MDGHEVSLLRTLAKSIEATRSDAAVFEHAQGTERPLWARITKRYQAVAVAPRTDGRAPYMQAVRGACMTD